MSSTSDKKPLIGLVMTGGGARGAYQAGVLKRIGEMRQIRRGQSPFQIIGGASAGSVNGIALAVGNHTFFRATRWMAELWSKLESGDIYRSDLGSLAPKVGRWIRDLSVGALVGGGHAHSLLDASPLRGFLKKHVNEEWIQANIERGNLHALTIAATSYSSGKTFIFIQGRPNHPTWIKSRRIALSSQITVDHICASAAIPIVFQPVRLETTFGWGYFGDGCLRMPAPLSPVVRMGADRILAIGVMSKRAAEESSETRDFNLDASGDVTPPPLAQVLGVALNAIFLDYLDTDVEHLQRLNEIIINNGLEGSSSTSGEPIRIIRPLAISPSVDLGQVAENYSYRMPALVRYLLRGLGTKEATSSDLMSYLLFDTEYTSALIDIGYKDASAHLPEIESFLFDA